MGKFIRQSKQERMKEIRNGALEVFLTKGYGHTTMENVVEAVNLSKGSVYKYYPSTEEMLIDLLKDGVLLRNDLLKSELEKLKEKNIPLSNGQMIKILSSLFFTDEIEGKHAKLYAMFLYEKRFNKGLKEVYEKINAWGISETVAMVTENGFKMPKVLTPKVMERLTHGMNTMVMGRFIEEHFNDEEVVMNVFETIVKEEEDDSSGG